MYVAQRQFYAIHRISSLCTYLYTLDLWIYCDSDISFMNLYKEFIIYFWNYTLMDFYTLTYLYTLDLWIYGFKET